MNTLVVQGHHGHDALIRNIPPRPSSYGNYYYHTILIPEKTFFLKFGAHKIWRPRRLPMSPMLGAGSDRYRFRPSYQAETFNRLL